MLITILDTFLSLNQTGYLPPLDNNMFINIFICRQKATTLDQFLMKIAINRSK